jgi:hypothetical protein
MIDKGQMAFAINRFAYTGRPDGENPSVPMKLSPTGFRLCSKVNYIMGGGPETRTTSLVNPWCDFIIGVA